MFLKPYLQHNTDYVVNKKKAGLKMSRGIIGIFKCEEKGKKWCSVSVRSSETSEKLRIALQSEHPELKIELAKAFSF